MLTTSKLTLDDPLSKVKGIGPKKSEALRQSGIVQIIDLLRIYPTRYQDRRSCKTVAQLSEGGECLTCLRLESIKSYHARRGLTVINAVFADATGKVTAKWFNRVYLIRQLIAGKHYWLFGQVTAVKNQLTLSNPEIEPVEEARTDAGTSSRLTPVYSSNTRLSEAGISALALRRLIAGILTRIDWDSSLPPGIRKSSFNAICDALEQAHRPTSPEEANKARHTLAFFDQVLFQIGVLKRRESLTGILSLPDASNAPPVEPEHPLPFSLTTAQKQSLGEIIFDMQEQGKDRPPMNRLVQGDVGSGKTLVAFLAMLHYCQKISPGSQCAFMAPTEILARQHLHSFNVFFKQFAGQACILTGSQKNAERKKLNQAIGSGEVKFVFGTHALFQENLEFADLGLCVIDEQQRFGVNHRRQLVRKGNNPHQLLLSATPIPRTLSLTIFGDMDTSTISELPPGRQPVKTMLATSFSQTVSHIETALQSGQQIYLVCPLIELSDKKDWTSVEEAAERTSELLPDVRFACLTGQQSWEEKSEIMQSFKNGQLDMVIATTVVEVGVDNPNATLMIIENADCFGLSQLHQLRGRVGRGMHASLCILVSHVAEESERLKVLAATNDGFELSLEDLRLRGPGDLVGTRQSGLSHPCFSHRISQKLIENARNRAFEILTGETGEVRDWFMAQMIKSFGDSYKTFMEGG
ncbi:MAG TPA: ATP-dependent DNA helicase RecG [Candidatus Riflebacteria bacterium]|nr:ATP-dependent DNA helicase RecG [Candidatus Riflebacteria bacterium]